VDRQTDRQTDRHDKANSCYMWTDRQTDRHDKANSCYMWTDRQLYSRKFTNVHKIHSKT